MYTEMALSNQTQCDTYFWMPERTRGQTRATRSDIAWAVEPVPGNIPSTYAIMGCTIDRLVCNEIQCAAPVPREPVPHAQSTHQDTLSLDVRMRVGCDEWVGGCVI